MDFVEDFVRPGSEAGVHLFVCSVCSVGNAFCMDTAKRRLSVARRATIFRRSPRSSSGKTFRYRRRLTSS